MIKKINKTQAIKAWRNGQDVGLIPCNFAPNNSWVSITWVNKNRYVEDTLFVIATQERYQRSGEYYQKFTRDADVELLAWETMYNNYAYYNLNSEVGNYPHYYIKLT